MLMIENRASLPLCHGIGRTMGKMFFGSGRRFYVHLAYSHRITQSLAAMALFHAMPARFTFTLARTCDKTVQYVRQLRENRLFLKCREGSGRESREWTLYCTGAQ